MRWKLWMGAAALGFLAALAASAAHAQDDTSDPLAPPEAPDIGIVTDTGAIEAATDLDQGELASDVSDAADGSVAGSEPEDDIDPADIRAILLTDNRSIRGALLLPRRILALYIAFDPKERRSAARSIGNDQNYLGIGALDLALADKDPAVRRAAADSLGKLGGFEALGALHSAQTLEQNPQTSRAMDKAIGNIEDRVFAGPGGGQPVTLICHTCGRKFVLLRCTQTGYCPYDGTIWKLPK